MDLLGSPFGRSGRKGGGCLSCLRGEEEAGVLHRRREGHLRVDSTSRVQFRCVRHLQPSFKTETKHHQSINEMSRVPPFLLLPVLFVIYAYKTVLVFIML